jgi:hypothetical protein
MNPGLIQTIVYGDLPAVKAALQTTWDEATLEDLYKKAWAEDRLALAKLISQRLDQIRGS